MGDAAAYAIRQLTLDGDTVRLIERAYEPVQVQTAELDSALAGLTGSHVYAVAVDEFGVQYVVRLRIEAVS